MTEAPPLKAVFFDLDGTLIDTACDFARVMDMLLARHNREPVAFERVRATVSMGASALVELGFGCGPDDPRFETLRKELLDLYETELSAASLPFEGMDEVLALIGAHELAWGIVTNKPLLYAQKLLAAMPLPECRILICPDHVSRRKPDPESLILACQHAGCQPGEGIYLGDHPRDVDCGRNAGMETIACAFGYIPPGEDVADWGADAVAHSPAEIAALLRRRLDGQARRTGSPKEQ